MRTDGPRGRLRARRAFGGMPVPFGDWHGAHMRMQHNAVVLHPRPLRCAVLPPIPVYDRVGEGSMPNLSPSSKSCDMERVATPSGSEGRGVETVATTCGSTELISSRPRRAADTEGVAGSSTAPKMRPASASLSANAAAFSTPLGVLAFVTPSASLRVARLRRFSADLAEAMALHFVGSSTMPIPE